MANDEGLSEIHQIMKFDSRRKIAQKNIVLILFKPSERF